MKTGSSSLTFVASCLLVSLCLGSDGFVQTVHRTPESAQQTWSAWSSCMYDYEIRYLRGCTSKTSSDCSQKRRCGVQPTQGTLSWGAWSSCNSGFRTRQKVGCDTRIANNNCVQRESCGGSAPWSQWSDNTLGSNWSTWSSCDNGIRTRKRQCDTQYQKNVCVQKENCRNSPTWTQWTDRSYGNWGSWTYCVSGSQTRTRTGCAYGKDQSNCRQQQRCGGTTTTWTQWTDKSYGNWGSWTYCVNGIQKRTRTGCAYGKDQSSCSQQQGCGGTTTTWTQWTDKSYGNWGSWTRCFYGTQQRTRTGCTGKDASNCREQQRCGETTNTWTQWTDKSYGNWGSWTYCVSGSQTRTRTGCAYGKDQSNCREQQRCGGTTTTWTQWTDKSYGNWGSWTYCVSGSQTRTRTGCAYGKDQSNCREQQRCGGTTTTWTQWTDKSYGNWGSWTYCVSGSQTRTRTGCAYGKDQSNCRQQQRCGGTTTTWTQWTDKSYGNWGSWTYCVSGTQTRTRTGCAYGKDQSNCRQQQRCGGTTTTWTQWTDKSYGNWGSWSTCIQGRRTRARTGCAYGKDQSNCRQNQNCGNTPSWSSWVDKGTESNWGSWSGCSNGLKQRTRQCTIGSQTTVCVEKQGCRQVTQRPMDSVWGSWSPCAYGVRTRRRSNCQGSSCVQQVACQNPTNSPSPANWGPWSACYFSLKMRRRRDCSTTDDSPACLQKQSCQGPTQKPFEASWGSWSACQNGVQTRRENCRQYQQCQTQSKSCSRTPAPSPSQWLSWGAWTACYKSVQVRTRTCAGNNCNGQGYETQSCFSQRTTQTETNPGWNRCTNSQQIRFQSCQGSPCQTAIMAYKDCGGGSTKGGNINGWGPWSQWTSCQNGIARRTRQCRGQCQGHSVETATCQIRFDTRQVGQVKG